MMERQGSTMRQHSIDTSMMKSFFCFSNNVSHKQEAVGDWPD